MTKARIKHVLSHCENYFLMDYIRFSSFVLFLLQLVHSCPAWYTAGSYTLYTAGSYLLLIITVAISRTSMIPRQFSFFLT